jgi:hypothetical protein
VFILLMIWLLPKLWRGIKTVFGFIGRLLGNNKSADPPVITIPADPVNTESVTEKKP